MNWLLGPIVNNYQVLVTFGLLAIVIALVVLVYQVAALRRKETTLRVDLDVEAGVQRLRQAAAEYADVLAIVKMLEQVTPDTLEKLKAYPEALCVTALAHRASVLTEELQRAHADYARAVRTDYDGEAGPLAKRRWHTVVSLQQKLDEVRGLMPPGLRAV